MNAEDARRLSNQNGFDKKVQEKIMMIERRIEIACSYGHTSTCAFADYNDDNKSDVDREAKNYFLNQGFRFKKTGICGGVPQDTEDICW